MEIYISNQTQNNTNISVLTERNFIARKVRFYCTIVIVIIGIIGNLISLFIFTRPNLNKKTNTGMLYTLLCTFNLLTFVEFAFFDPNFHLGDWIILNDRISNMIELLIRISLTEILPWIQVLICFDRFILVIYPTKANIMRKKVCFSFNNYIYI